MSDGNFNRNLLPYTQFKSGLRTGESRMRMFAVEAFELWLEKECTALAAEEREEKVEMFKRLLEERRK